MCHNQNWDPKPHQKKSTWRIYAQKLEKAEKVEIPVKYYSLQKPSFPTWTQFLLFSGMGNLPICRKWEVTKLRSRFGRTSELIDSFGVLFSEIIPFNGNSGLPRTHMTSRQRRNTSQWDNWTVRCQSRWPMRWNCNWKCFTPCLNCLAGRSFHVNWPCWAQQPSASITDNFTKGTSKNKNF